MSVGRWYFIWKSCASEILAIGLLVNIAGCSSALDKRTAGLEVTAAGRAIYIKWSEDHPWGTQIARAGHQMGLYAQYSIGAQRVEERIASGRTLGQSMEFKLPAALKAVPTGGVCLFVASAGRTGAIPVRLDGGISGDTAGFRYKDWEASIESTTRVNSLKNDIRLLESSIAGMRQTISRLQSKMGGYKVRHIEECSRVNTSSASALPSSAVHPAERLDVSKRICIRRSRNMSADFMRPEYRVDVQEFAAEIVRRRYAQVSEVGLKRASDFMEDMSRWKSATGESFRPEVGSANDLLPTGSVVDDMIKRFNTSGANADDRQGRAIGLALMEAYSACLEDVNKQLTVQYDAWERAKTSRPERDRLYADYLQRQCVADFKDLNTLTDSIQVFTDRMAAQRRKLELSGGENPVQASLPASRPLNGESCVGIDG